MVVSKAYLQLMFLCTSIVSGSQVKKTTKPHVILIVADDLGK